MVKAKKFMLFGMFILIFSFALVSANTLVGGKIYNSDFSEVLEGIVVSVECGSEIPQNTESLSDGAYAVIFDSDKCPFDSSVTVSASEGELTDEESSTVYKSEEDGELVAVVNLNLHSTTQGSGGSRKYGTWFQCGNTVCDSGETFDTCPEDCPETTEEETPTGLLDLSSNSGNSDDSLSGETQNPEENGNNAGITGAVTGAESSGNKGNFLILLGGLIFLLIIAIIVMVSVEKNMKKKLGAGVAEVNVQ